MTSLASLILKINSLTRQSQFYLSQYLGALIHLPHAWRNLHADIHLTSLTLIVLQLSRQLRLNSLIRIGAPPLLKLIGQPSRSIAESETEINDAINPLDLPKLQKPQTRVQDSIVNIPDTLQAIIRPLFQTTPRSGQPLYAGRIASTVKPEVSPSILTSTPQQLPSSARLTDETPAEESLRENVVETWLHQQGETGRRPTISFVEAHKLYRDLYKEFVSTATLPSDQFAQNFLQTPPNLTLDQAKTELRIRLDAGLTQENERSTLKTQTDTVTPIPSILTPLYIAATLWAKGSLAFGTSPQSTSSTILRVVPDRLESSPALNSLRFEERQSNLNPNRLNQQGASSHQLGTRSSDTQTLKLPGEQGTPDIGRNFVGELTPGSSDREAHLPPALLEARARPTQPSTEPSNLPPFAGYQGLQNQLYRVEAHDSGPLERSEIASQRYSPAAALCTTLAAHATLAFISPTHGNRHTSPPTINTPLLKPPFAIAKDLKTVAFTDIRPDLGQHEEPMIERFERILPIVESHPTPIYLRPPMNLPTAESTVPQRTPASTLPSPSIAPTRESISNQDLDREKIPEEGGEPEGYPEVEGDSDDAAIRKQVKRMGKIIAEEARRHIGST